MTNYKIILIGIGTSLTAGVCAYAAYKYLWKRDSKVVDEGFEDVSRIEETPVRRILVLGLEGAGKSTIVKQLTESVAASKGLEPTAGFYVVMSTTMEKEGVTFNIWEVGGGESCRPYWSNFFEGTDLLVFVVDSADMRSLSMAVREVTGMLADPRLTRVPIVLVAHKQDLPNAMTPEEVAKALDVKHSHRAVTVVGTCAPPQANERDLSLKELENTLVRLSVA